jgi:DNA replication and repair protein RecF
VEGPNGSGKTSLLEALHYLCYLRSFRTHTPRDLVNLEASSFFIKAQLIDKTGNTTDIQIGFSGKKRLVKVNQKPVQSFKELMDYYRVITITEDDLTLIKGSPDVRRSFLDQSMVLFDPESIVQLRTFKAVVEQRNSLLGSNPSSTSIGVWTKQLWEQSRNLQRKRKEMLERLEGQVNELLLLYFSQKEGVTVQLVYTPKNDDLGDSFEQFLQKSSGVFEEEFRLRRSLFGAHLDDFSIIFCQKKSKVYASRGQQKLLTVLLKIAQMKELVVLAGPSIFLLDDFLTDFDETTAKTLISLLISLKSQLIFTCPVQGGVLDQELTRLGAHKAKLTH